MKVVRLGNFVVAIKEEDEAQLKELYKDAAQIRMAGGMQGYQQLAAGKAMMGAGEGMAKGGGDGGGCNPMLGGAGLGIGFGMASMFQQKRSSSAQQPQQPQRAGAGGRRRAGDLRKVRRQDRARQVLCRVRPGARREEGRSAPSAASRWRPAPSSAASAEPSKPG